MRPVRIYKDNIREHILRSLFFTDTMIFICGAAICAGLLWITFNNILHFFQWGAYISSVIVTEVFFFVFITQRIENQPIYRIFPRAIIHIGSKKKYRHKELPSPLTDFSVVDTYILRRNELIAIFSVEPFDIALLNNEDREHFYQSMKQMIHTLPGKMQIIVRKEKAKVSDYSKHFFSIYEQSEKKREGLINSYITDLSRLIETDQFLIVKYYAVFSTSVNPNMPQSMIDAKQKLLDMGNRLSSALSSCNIHIKQLSEEQLIEFCKTQLR